MYMHMDINGAIVKPEYSTRIWTGIMKVLWMHVEHAERSHAAEPQDKQI